MCTSFDLSICTELSCTMYIYSYMFKITFRLFCTSTIFVTRASSLKHFQIFNHSTRQRWFILGLYLPSLKMSLFCKMVEGNKYSTLSVTCSMVSVVFCSMSQRRTSSSCMRSPSYSEGILHTHPTLYTDNKEIKFSSHIRKFRGIGCKVIHDCNDLIYRKIFVLYLVY